MTTIDLTKFCCEPDDNCRYDFSKPFTRGGWTYASDGRISVRVKTDAPDTDLTKVAPAWNLNWGLCSKAVDPLPTDPYPLVKNVVEKCPDCHGEERDCDECNGTGNVLCEECGYSHTCKKCDGSGDGTVYTPKNCKTCSNLREIRVERTTAYIFDIGSEDVFVALSDRNYDLIRELPNLKINLKLLQQPIPFTFDGGEGLVMEVNIENEDKARAAEYFKLRMYEDSNKGASV